MGKIFVDELEEKQSISSVFLAQDKVVLTGKNKKTYIGVKFYDKSGFIDGRIWENVEDLKNRFQNGDFVLVQGFVQKYQERLQLVVSSVDKVPSSEISIEDYVRTATGDIDEMFAQIISIVSHLKSPFIKELILKVLNEPDIQKKFKKCPAAKTIHHAYYGGLLEHCLSICKLMDFLAGHYKVLDKDLLIFGALFHDIGKIWELEFDLSFNYTDAGRLVGHLVMGSELIEKYSQQIPTFPDELRLVLKHIVLSHHGRLDYGSPKRPKFLEAYVVSMIDELDSKINTIGEFISHEKQGGQRWTRFNDMFERYFFTGTYDNEKE